MDLILAFYPAYSVGCTQSLGLVLYIFSFYTFFSYAPVMGNSQICPTGLEAVCVLKNQFYEDVWHQTQIPVSQVTASIVIVTTVWPPGWGKLASFLKWRQS